MIFTTNKLSKTFILVGLSTLILVGFTIYRVFKLYQHKVTTIDPQLKEVSGIEFDKHQRLWAINDGGDSPLLYHLQRNGKVKQTIEITNAHNIDWEDMTQDDFGHFFIGDFGNNDASRNWLTIYKIENPIDIKESTTKAEIIKFTYPKELLPLSDSSNKNQDLEAFVYYKKQLYFFTKNRTEPFDGKTHLIKTGDSAANYKAKYISSFTTCTSFKEACWITSAALSPDRQTLVLLDSKSLWLFKHWQEDDFFSGEVYQIDLGVITQKESVTFFDNDRIVFTDEEFKGIGRNAYVINLKEAQLNKVN